MPWKGLGRDRIETSGSWVHGSTGARKSGERNVTPETTKGGAMDSMLVNLILIGLALVVFDLAMLRVGHDSRRGSEPRRDER